MTSREEALRALEKEMQADGGRVEYYAGRLSTILATASEQAPVAEIGELNGTKLIVGRDEEALSRLPKGTKLYASSPAHTSEARDAQDAARWRAARNGLSDYHGDVYLMTFAEDGDYPVVGDDADNRADKMVRRAAMRQEAGSRD